MACDNFSICEGQYWAAMPSALSVLVSQLLSKTLNRWKLKRLMLCSWALTIDKDAAKQWPFNSRLCLMTVSRPGVPAEAFVLPRGHLPPHAQLLEEERQRAAHVWADPRRSTGMPGWGRAEGRIRYNYAVLNLSSQLCVTVTVHGGSGPDILSCIDIVQSSLFHKFIWFFLWP